METLSAKFASTIRETRQWLEDCQELPSIPRAEEEELQSLLAFAKAEKSKAAEHQRRLQSLKFQASKVKPKISAPPSETTSEADEPAELLSSLRQKLQDSCSVGTLTGLLEVLKDTSSLPEAQQKNLATIQEVARERLAQLSKEAEEAAAQHHAQEAELRELQKQKEELLGKVKEARWMAERAKNAQDGDSVTSRDTSAGAVEEHSNPSSRSNSDVGLRPEAPPERTGPEVEKAPERPAFTSQGQGQRRSAQGTSQSQGQGQNPSFRSFQRLCDVALACYQRRGETGEQGRVPVSAGSLKDGRRWRHSGKSGSTARHLLFLPRSGGSNVLDGTLLEEEGQLRTTQAFGGRFRDHRQRAPVPAG